jgi:prepilin-type processing-associated H-X9-DG protein
LNEAWYNVVAKMIGQQSMVELYTQTPANPPLPSSHNLHACPAAPLPSSTLYPGPPAGTPKVTMAYFMYGENSRLCVNRSTRATGVPQTKISNVVKPTDTIVLAEVDGNSPSIGIANSVTTGQYAIARHSNRGNFSMVDGGARSYRTNDFIRTSTDANSSSSEWANPRAVYWYPTSTTPN